MTVAGTIRLRQWLDMKSSSQSNSVADSFMTGKLRWSLRLRMIIELTIKRARRGERFAWAQYSRRRRAWLT